ncbi:MAG: monovalent cation/H(+) antiporter subunit G [Kiloniellaceae bacterium]
MEALLDILSWGLLGAGAVFSIIGGVGLIRLPDVYARLHGVGVTDTLGAGLMLIGLMVQGGLSQVTVKLALILVFLLYTSPTSSYAVANAAFRSGLEPVVGGKDGEKSRT